MGPCQGATSDLGRVRFQTLSNTFLTIAKGAKSGPTSNQKQDPPVGSCFGPLHLHHLCVVFDDIALRHIETFRSQKSIKSKSRQHQFQLGWKLRCLRSRHTASMEGPKMGPCQGATFDLQRVRFQTLSNTFLSSKRGQKRTRSDPQATKSKTLLWALVLGPCTCIIFASCLMTLHRDTSKLSETRSRSKARVDNTGGASRAVPDSAYLLRGPELGTSSRSFLVSY